MESAHGSTSTILLAPKLGLRERKKLKTRQAIQREALRLFTERGYQKTTIEDIAEAVEISPATFFNYFPSKEDVVFLDDLDPVIIAAFQAQPPELSPIGALRKAMRSVLAGLTPEQQAMQRQREALITSVPDLRAAMLNQFAGLVQEIADVIAHRVGRKADGFAVRNLAGALVGVIIAATDAAADDPAADYMELMDAAMAHLEAGLPL